MKKIISICLALVMIFSINLCAFAAPIVEDGSKYPYILVHGMMGWGDDSTVNNKTAYWGFDSELENNVNMVVSYFQSQGLEAYAPSVSPLGSAWDRACELYAKLTGTRVDYGEAHSKEAGHNRYGRDYTGKALMGEAWDYENGEKLNLISHSFGGPTIRVLTSLMAYGDEAEIKASGDDCSPLFKGGYEDAIFSVSTLCSPHNGSPVANLLNDTRLPIFLFALAINKEGTKQNPSTDYMFDQWGITGDPSKNETVKFSLAKCIKISKSKDLCSYDMTLRGATELNKRFKTVSSVYYFSYVCDMSANASESLSNDPKATFMKFTGLICKLSAGKYIDGKILGEEWGKSDGIVPVPSAKYPNSDENNYVNYESGMAIQKGVWHSMPVIEDATHGYHVVNDEQQLSTVYSDIISLIASCPM